MKVEHLGGDRWRVRIPVGKGLDGRYRQMSKTFRADGARKARSLGVQYAGDLERRKREAADRRLTVDGLADEWERLKTSGAESTKYRNRSILAAIRRDLGPIRLVDLSPRHLDHWYAKLLAEGRSPSTVHHYHRVLHSMLNRAERYGDVPVAVTRKSEPPTRPRPRPRPPETTALVALLHDAPPSLRVAASLAAKLGLRRGEVLGARWSDLQAGRLHVIRSITDVPGQPLAVKTPKSERSVREIPLDPTVVELLERWHADCLQRMPELAVDAYIVPDPFDPSGRTPQSPGKVSQAWRRLCRQHGVSVRFHDLRHWAATNMIAAGVAVTTVADMLGHAQVSTTLNVYARALPGSDERAAAVLGALLP